MIQSGSILHISDRSGVALGECIKVIRATKKQIAYIGDVIIVVVKRLNFLRFAKLKERQQRRFSRGTLHRALILRSCVFFNRVSGLFVRFNMNAAVLVNKKVVPLSNRIYGPVLFEFSVKFQSIGCVTRFII